MPPEIQVDRTVEYPDKKGGFGLVLRKHADLANLPVIDWSFDDFARIRYGRG